MRRGAADTTPGHGGRSVRFRADDGKAVAGRYTPAGDDAPGVVLLHEIRGGPDQWAPLILPAQRRVRHAGVLASRS